MKHAAALLLLTLVGCVSAPSVKSWLDPVSSATITAQLDPLILARRGDEREFAQLAAIEVNRMGERRLYLVAILWSSVNRTRTAREIFEGEFSRVELRVDERIVTLERHQGEPAELGVGQSPLPLPIPGSQQLYFPIDRADLRALASSNRVQLIAHGRPETPQLYEEWQDGRQSLSDFLSQLPGEAQYQR